MCGLVVNYSLDKTDITSALKWITHRGPDNTGSSTTRLKNGRNITLGHTRLSILGIGEESNQPFVSKCGQFELVFNGEIYNFNDLKQKLVSCGYNFDTSSDTEVLIYTLIEFKEKALELINGMFAFVFLNKNDLTLFIARDQFGIKPLYFSFDKSSFMISSELVAISKALDLNTLNFDYLGNYINDNQTDYGQATFYNGILNFPPASYCIVDLGAPIEFNLNKYWDVDTNVSVNKVTFKEAALNVRKLFLESVKRQMVSEVNIGAALSGGIDSSSIVCAMRYLDPNIEINTFSFISSNESQNEEKWVDIVNEHVGATPHKVYLNKKELSQGIEKCLVAQQEPVLGSSVIAQYSVFKKAKDNNVKVILDGQGADEIFTGYNFYYSSYILSKLNLNELKEFYIRFNTISNKIGFYNTLKEVLMNTRIGLRLKKIRNRNFLKVRKSAQKKFDLSKPVSGSMLKKHLKETLLKTSLPRLLRYDDRNSMASSVESRVPFLDRQLVEFVYSLPDEYLISKEGVSKYILREAMRGIVPDEILDRKDKVGFATPESDWMQSLNFDFEGSLARLKQNYDVLDDQKILSLYSNRESNLRRKMIWKIMNLSILTKGRQE